MFRRPPPSRIPPSEIAPPEVFFDRRSILAGGLALGMSSLLPAAEPQPALAALKYTRNAKYSTNETPNSYEDVTGYNNFYEFGTGKEDPKENAHTLRPRPWNVSVEGEAEVTGRFTLEDILKPHALEERIYRLRCVERWSIVVPWVGFPLGDLIKRFKPTSRARYVEMTTLYDPKQMPYQRTGVLPWPYVEGLRMDEAMHPLTLLVVGVYGKVLPNQNGAPLRLVVPWKYGFKGVKSIVKLRFVERQPRTTWALSSPDEYGFYANVNPAVDHPRWSQAKERRLGKALFSANQDTLMFNGYQNEVADLYRGMDLRKFF
jgi:methionine sulfoxide reductase catalytic subunit